MLRSSRNVALSSVLLACCGTRASSDQGSGDAAPRADAGAETSTTGRSGGVGGGSGTGGGAGVGGASGTSGGTGGNGGNGAAGAGGGGATAGRGGSADGGGAAGSSGGGQAGTSGGDRDAARDAAPDTADASSDVTSDRSVDASAEAGTDASDAQPDTSMPPADGTGCTPLPGAGVYATFRVVNDVFYASITNASGIDQALALWRGQSQAKIPVGQLECGNGTYNCGWTWRMNPSSITFAEITIEVCDATPSYVQGNCASFPNGQYCPWSAELISLRDCRTDPGCPAVAR